MFCIFVASPNRVYFIDLVVYIRYFVSELLRNFEDFNSFVLYLYYFLFISIISPFTFVWFNNTIHLFVCNIVYAIIDFSPRTVGK